MTRVSICVEFGWIVTLWRSIGSNTRPVVICDLSSNPYNWLRHWSNRYMVTMCPHPLIKQDTAAAANCGHGRELLWLENNLRRPVGSCELKHMVLSWALVEFTNASIFTVSGFYGRWYIKCVPWQLVKEVKSITDFCISLLHHKYLYSIICLL